jgi:predicted small integral membrane protein
MRKALRGRVAVFVVVAIGLAGMLAWQQATRPDPVDQTIRWRLETLAGQRVHVNLNAVQRQARNL